MRVPVLLVTCALLPSTCALSTLYPAGELPDDHIILELNVTNFDRDVYKQQKVHFAQFYSSWCGHCINFAPKFKTFALDVWSWQPMLQLVVVNCANSVNLPLCRVQGIRGTPTLKLIPYNGQSVNDTMNFIGQTRDPAVLSLDLALLVAAQAAEHIPPGWPSFQLDHSLDSIPELVLHPSVSAVLLVVQSYDARLGNAVGHALLHYFGRRGK